MNRTKVLLLAGTVLPAFALAAPSMAAPQISNAPIVLAQADDLPGRGGGRGGEGGGRPERAERPEKSERPARAERPDKPERAERPDKPERAERPDKPERAERPDKPERAERPDKPERPGKPDRAERPDKPEKPDRPSPRDAGADKPDRTLPSAKDRAKDAAETPDRVSPRGADSPSLKDKMRGEKPDRPDKADKPDRADPSEKPTPTDRATPSANEKPSPTDRSGGSLRERMQNDKTGRDSTDKPGRDATDKASPSATDKPNSDDRSGGSLKDRMQRDKDDKDDKNARDKDKTDPNATDRTSPSDRNDAKDRRGPDWPNGANRNQDDRNNADRDRRDRNDGDRNANDRDRNDARDRDRDRDSARDREDRNLDPGEREKRDANREKFRNDSRYTIRDDKDRRSIYQDRDFNERDSRSRFEKRIQDNRRDARDDRDRADFSINFLRDKRRERRDGDRVYIDEPGGRTIIRDGDRTYIRRDENERFRGLYDSRDFREERGEGGNTRTIITRPDGSQIITVTDEDGRLVSRTRRYNDQDYVLIDNRPRGGGRLGAYVDLRLPPPRISIPREEYIVDADEASYDQIETAFRAPPVERLERSYSLDEIRQNDQLRARVRSVDLDAITFDTGSWDVSDDQIKKLENVGLAMEAAIKKDPKTVFMIEGHTDAVGNDDDNLSLSDRRAESVAKILTKYFDLPAENLTTQGYGEQYLKVKTEGAEVRNRRVTVRNITPLLTSEK